VGALWDDADLVIAIGTDFDGMTTQNWALPRPPRLLVINVDEQDGAKNYPPDLVLVGDAAQVTDLLTKRIPPASHLADTRQRLERVRTALRETIAEDDPDALAFLDAMAELVPDQANVIADMCIPGYWLAGFPSRTPTARLRLPDGVGHARVRAASLRRRRRRRRTDRLRVWRRRLSVRLRRASNPGAGAAAGDGDRRG
jgi:thiamine pyrophosphate-dependent acetolactate synthase large subunit-like protein